MKNKVFSFSLLIIFSFIIVSASFGAVYDTQKGGISLPTEPVNPDETFDSLNTLSFVETYSDGSAFKADITEDGTRLVRTGSSINISSYSLSVNHNLSTSSRTETSNTTNLSTSGDLTSIRGVEWHPSGDTLFVADDTEPDHEFSFSLSTQWDVTTTNEEQFYDMSEIDGNMRGAKFSDDGKHLYAVDDASNQKIEHYSLSNAWDLNSITHEETLDVSSNVSGVYSVLVEDNGKKMFVVDRGSTEIDEYSMTTSHDLSSANYERSLDVSANVGDPTDIFISYDSGDMILFVADFGSGYAKYQ